ncbi:thioesterase family protein [Lewinella sp. W8]|uniref:acyl-CoA thioesterase n=1 Tax=Lewinella sp. W8 TaxID=2528208 RepID=UPI001068642E|nr:thioesterase family protein [Lewinella sp. W8]MTB50702.1 acyl-CoA thioesterase [Lewinella sp. W8]
MQEKTLADFPLQAYDKLRYADTDRQGHVNNATFATFLETGRVEFIYHREAPLLAEGHSFVIASMHINFIREIHWPGRVEIGTGITKIGNSSVGVYQQLFQGDICVASAETVIVQVSDQTARPAPLTEAARASLQRWFISPED